LIDDVAAVIANLNAVTDLEWLTPENECPSCQVDQRGLQGNRETGREQAEIC
jgi:hypothetical protein